MITYREGQEVEVRVVTQEAYAGFAERRRWRKAKIIAANSVNYCDCPICNSGYTVQFPDGTHGTFDEGHIRDAPFENEGLNEELQKHEMSKRDFAGRKGENPEWE